MRLLAPAGLWMLGAAVLALVAHLAAQWLRHRHAVRFANARLLASVAPQRPGWRRHLAAGCMVLGLAVLAVATARPVLERDVERDRAVVVVALDVSPSMEASDVPPTRLDAAKRAAAEFVRGLPAGFHVGVVAYGSAAQVVTQPTTDHDRAASAIGQLRTTDGTAAGEALVAALDAVETTLAELDLAPDPDAGPPATVVLLSDGASSDGRPVAEVAQRAARSGVPVSTITYGTPDGTVEIDGEQIAVPPDAGSMQELAAITGGRSFAATSGDELAAVYEDVRAQVGTVREQQEVTVPTVVLGIGFVLAAVGLGLLWRGRVV